MFSGPLRPELPTAAPWRVSPADLRRQWMTRVFALIALGLALVSAGRAPALRSGSVDAAVTRGIASGLIAGGVVAIGSGAGPDDARAYGRAWAGEDAEVLAEGAVFDVASLTKVVATTPAVLKLAEEGRLGLDDRLGRWFPELEGTVAAGVSVVECLTHTSGLRDLPALGADPWGTLWRGLRSQAEEGLRQGRFRYADVNFILLGELVRRASGVPLDEYVSSAVFAPLGMTSTRFRPADGVRARCVPTAVPGGIRRGDVQDPQAADLRGVAGHAGLFSTASDLARFCRAVLRGGELDGVRVLSETSVRLMTAPRPCGGAVVRALGWDVSSPYSSPRAEAFSPASFGHTGYSGVSLWIDPALDSFVVFLSSRLEYRRTREFNRLRGEISAAAAEAARRD